MSDRHTSNDMESAWERRNAGHERLKALADSINDTARMARATLSLLLVAALYLGFTLLASTDENLLLNAEVTVLQVGSGIALKQSYTFGPWVFLYLHLQALFVLLILHRKIGRFNTAVNDGIYNSKLTRQEYWDWLSAFAFVQRFRPDHHSHIFSRFPSRFLMWISTEAIPLALLFIVTLSFVRYQSEFITCMHKVTFIVTLCSVILFNLSVSGIQLRPFYKLPNQIALRIKKFTIPLRFTLVFKAACAIFMTLVLFIWARPPTFYFASHDERKLIFCEERKPLWKVMEEERFHIWRTRPNDREMRQESKQHTSTDCRRSTSLEKVRWNIRRASTNSRGKHNFLDAAPCELFGFVCRRYLDVENLWLVTTRPSYVSASKGNISNAADSDEKEWFHINHLSLSGRNFRFANFRHAQLQGANLEFAELQGANLESSNLQDANLTRTHMHGALLSSANLQGAVFQQADIQGANLNWTKSQGANFANARLRNVSLKYAGLQNAPLVKADLHDADMKDARLDNARLWKANLEGAILENALLRGAILNYAELQNANLRNAKLEGANLRSAKLLNTDIEGAQLEGVDLSDAKIWGSLGTPDSWDLAWPPDVLEYYSNKPDVASEKMDKAVEKKWRSFVNELDKVPPDKTPIPSEYWNRLAVWTAKFACRNKYTARGSWNRWNSDEPLMRMKERVDEEIINREKGRILQLILDGRRCKECAGLHDTSDEEWKRWQRKSAEIRRKASRMHGVLDPHPACWEWPRPDPTKVRLAPRPPNDDFRFILHQYRRAYHDPCSFFAHPTGCHYILVGRDGAHHFASRPCVGRSCRLL